MEYVQHIAPILLLFHVLCPLIAGVLVLGLLKNSEQLADRIGLAVTGLLIVSSLALLGVLSGEPTQEIGIHWMLPGRSLPGMLVYRASWGLIPGAAEFLCLLPWVALTARAFTTTKEISAVRTGTTLLLLGAIGLFVAGRDVGSLLTGAFLSVLLIALQISRHGIENKRASASLLLTIEAVGLGLFTGGLAMFIACASLIRSAPYGLPGASSTSLPELINLIQTAIHQHPAALELWGVYRMTPSLLVFCGILVMGAGFPMQVWMSEVSESAAMEERLWLLIWVKAVFLIGLKLLFAINPAAAEDFGWNIQMIAVPGALFVSSLLLSQAYLPRLQSSGLVWTQQLTLIAVFSAWQNFGSRLELTLISHTAAILLFTIVLTLISERYRSVEISSFQGLAARNLWIGIVLAVCLLTMTLSPMFQGLEQAWMTTVTLLGSETWFGTLNRSLYYLANLLALAGLARVCRQLSIGPLRLPEMSTGLRERTALPDSTVSLDISRGQGILLFIWICIALGTSFLIPIQQFAFQPLGLNTP